MMASHTVGQELLGQLDELLSRCTKESVAQAAATQMLMPSAPDCHQRILDQLSNSTDDTKHITTLSSQVMQLSTDLFRAQTKHVRTRCQA